MNKRDIVATTQWALKGSGVSCVRRCKLFKASRVECMKTGKHAAVVNHGLQAHRALAYIFLRFNRSRRRGICHFPLFQWNTKLLVTVLPSPVLYLTFATAINHKFATATRLKRAIVAAAVGILGAQGMIQLISLALLCSNLLRSYNSITSDKHHKL